jgi:3-oxoacyl-[acyl-carrier-protein] synthase-3
MNQVKRSITDTLMGELGLKEAQTMRTMKEYGHMGPVDTLFCLALAREEGRIHPGDLVVLAGSSIGFTWAATVLKYR